MNTATIRIAYTVEELFSKRLVMVSNTSNDSLQEMGQGLSQAYVANSIAAPIIS